MAFSLSIIFAQTGKRSRFYAWVARQLILRHMPY